MQSAEQRTAFRIQMPDGQKQATLRIQGRKFDVQLLDASATGVAIACPLQVTLGIDDCCELLTASGGSWIRVVRKEVFSDGILLGAERTSDVRVKSHGVLGHASDLFALSQRMASGSVCWKVGLISLAMILAGGVGAAAWHWNWFGGAARASMSAALENSVPEMTEPVEPTAEEVQEALQQAEALISKLKPVVSESDQRAQRIFEQQQQLLTPAMVRRLKLSPAQESQIQRALEPAAAAANQSSHEFWEAIRRSEQKILSILTPAQAKLWRQQSGI